VKVVESLAALREARAELEEPLGLMPTLGYLHSGHLSLVRQARQICASVAASIFVNPTQFGPAEDLSTYPRDLDRDLALLEAEGVDLVWTPSNEEVYPSGFQTWVQVEQVSQPLEGAYRPGHFRGVTTVVLKLFSAFQPQKAYFGQKDAQQVVVIKRMVQDLNLPVKIEVCPTVREPDGLAMSSRNSYLDPAQRRAASVLYRALQEAEQAFEAGERQAQTLRERLAAVVAAEPLARPQYISVADPETLQELSGSVDRALLSMAVYIGRTRLIDNLVIEAGG
jgi:pantoate--beta-alanine ligase